MIEDSDPNSLTRPKHNKLVLSGQEFEKYKTAIIHYATQCDKSINNLTII